MFLDAQYGPFPECRSLRKSNTMNPARDLKYRAEPAPDLLRIIRLSFQTSKYWTHNKYATKKKESGMKTTTLKIQDF